MNVLLPGAGGMLARAVQAVTPSAVSLHPYTRAQLDISSDRAVRAALEIRPDWVINCAAFTRVDATEEHEGAATLINGDAVGLVAREAGAVGVRVVHVSTDYVFDGTLDRPYREDDAPNPQGAYGRSKLAGERALAASGAEWTVIRTQWLYGGGASFVRTMWLRAEQGLASRVVDDQWGAPTHVAELAAVIWQLVGDGAHGSSPAGAGGIWHAAASGETNWYEVARQVYALVGADPALVARCSTAEYGATAPRPANGRLDTQKLANGGVVMRPWEAVLKAAVLAARGGADGP